MGNVLNLKERETSETEEGAIHEGTETSEIRRDVAEDAEDVEGVMPDTTALFVEEVAWEASTAPDALERRKEHAMLAILGIIALGVAVWQRNMMLVVIAGLTVFAWEVQHRHGHSVQVSIDRTGIHINGRKHSHEGLASFAIQKLPDGSAHLSIKTEATLSPSVRVPLGAQDHEEVRSVLLNYLMEEEHAIPMSELFLKS